MEICIDGFPIGVTPRTGAKAVTNETVVIGGDDRCPGAELIVDEVAIWS